MKIKLFGSDLLKINLLPCLQKNGIGLSDNADMAFGLNDFYDTASFSLKKKIPMAIWFTDIHKRTTVNFPPFLKNNSFLFCFSHEQTRWFKETGWKNACYLPLAVDCQTFHPRDKEYDISFMGELSHMTTDNPMVSLLQPLFQKAASAKKLGVEINKFPEMTMWD